MFSFQKEPPLHHSTPELSLTLAVSSHNEVYLLVATILHGRPDVWPSQHRENTPKAAEVPGAPSAEPRSTPTETRMDLRLGESLARCADSTAAPLGLMLVSHLARERRFCGAPSLSGHPSRHSLNMAPGLAIQSIAALQQFAVKTLQNQGCKQGFMIWGPQSRSSCPHHLRAQQLPISKASCDIWCKLRGHQLVSGNLCLCLAP